MSRERHPLESYYPKPPDELNDSTDVQMDELRARNTELEKLAKRLRHWACNCEPGEEKCLGCQAAEPILKDGA